MEEFNCRVFEMEWADVIMYLDREVSPSASTVIDVDAGLKIPTITIVRVYTFTNHTDVKKRVKKLSELLGDKLNTVYLRGKKYNMPKYYVVYHAEMHTYGNFDILRNDLKELCKGLDLAF